MRPRAVVAALSIVAVALTVAMLWNADERGEVETDRGASSAAANPSDVTPLESADAARRASVDVPAVADAAAVASLAFVGRVADVAGHALADVRVAIVTSADARTVIVAETRTLADGTFELPARSAIPATLEFTSSGQSGAVREGVIPNEPIVVLLEAGVTVTGRVIDSLTRAPVAGAEVSLENAGYIDTATQFSGEHGEFAIGVRRVPALLRAAAEGHGYGRAFVAIATEPVVIELASGESAATAWYRIVDRESREPIENAVIRPDPTERVESGLYRGGIWFGSDQGRCSRIRAPGYLEHSLSVRGVGGEDATHPIEVALRRAGSMRGTLVEANRCPLADATITVRRTPTTGAHPSEPDAWFQDATAVTDSAGAFTIADVPIGVPLQLVAERDGALLLDRSPIEVASLEPLLLGELRAEAGCAMDVFVMRAADKAVIANALVRAFDGKRVRVMHADASGRASLPALGRIRHVVASAPGFAPVWQAVEPASPAQRIECALGPAAHLAGIVTDLDGAPLAGAIVGARLVEAGAVVMELRGALEDPSFDPSAWSCVTDASGRFALSDLAAGKYRLFANHADASPFAFGGGSADQSPVETDRDDLVLTLARHGTIVAHVTSAQTGTALDHVALSATTNPRRSASGNSEPRTSGYVTLQVVAGQKIDLTVSSGGYAPRAFLGVVLAPGEVRLLEVPLDAESSFAGIARFEDGTPAIGVTIKLTPKTPGLSRAEIPCDTTGAFKATRLAAGEFALTARRYFAHTPSMQFAVRVDPANVVIGIGEARTQDVVIRMLESGPFEMSFDAESVPADRELVGFDIDVYAGDEEVLVRSLLPSGEPVRVPGLPLGACRMQIYLWLRTKTNGDESHVSSIVEPATFNVTKNMGNLSFVVRPKPPQARNANK